MPNPTLSDVHIKRPLTNFAQNYMARNTRYVASVAMPQVPVEKQADIYRTFNADDFLRDDAQERAPGTESSGSDFTLGDETYYTKVYAHHYDVYDQIRANADSEIRLEQKATELVTGKLLLRKEVLFANTFFVPGKWTTEVQGVASGVGAGEFLQWDQTNSSPIVDIQNGIDAVELLTGFTPNRILMGKAVWNSLINHDEILSRIIGGAFSKEPAIVQRNLISQLFEVNNIYVMQSRVNTAPKGAAANWVRIGGNHVLIYYAPEEVLGAQGEEPTAGATFNWTGYVGATKNGVRVGKFRMEHLKSDRIEGEMAFAHKVTSADLGYFMQDVIA